MRVYLLLVCLLSSLLVACEAPATPLAAGAHTNAPPEAPMTSAVPLQTLRYGILADSRPHLDISLIEAVVPVETINRVEDIAGFDLVIGLGRYEGWQMLSMQQHVSLAIRTDYAPLDIPSVTDLISTVLDVSRLINALGTSGMQETVTHTHRPSAEIRTILANDGYPDGLMLRFASPDIPASALIQEQFAEAGITLVPAIYPMTEPNPQAAHLVLFTWLNAEERASWQAQFGDDTLIDLWTIPISYITSERVTVRFAENGLPIPQR